MVADQKRREIRGAREQLLDAAERLFGTWGFEAVSLRSIASAAGQANNSAVRYHFETKERLAYAIFERRALSYEHERAKRLAILKAAGKLEDPHALLGAILLPLAQTNNPGAYNYALFLKRLVEFHVYSNLRADIDMLLPITTHLVDLLGSVVGLSHAVFRYRLRRCNLLFLNCLVDPNVTQFGDPHPFESWDQKIEAALASTTAAMLAPPAASPTGQTDIQDRADAS